MLGSSGFADEAQSTTGLPPLPDGRRRRRLRRGEQLGQHLVSRTEWRARAR